MKKNNLILIFVFLISLQSLFAQKEELNEQLYEAIDNYYYHYSFNYYNIKYNCDITKISENLYSY